MIFNRIPLIFPHASEVAVNFNSVHQFAFRRLVSRFVLHGCLFMCVLPAGLFAQTVAFTGAQRTLGSGFSGLPSAAVDRSESVRVADAGKVRCMNWNAQNNSCRTHPRLIYFGKRFG
jgi:hypothetical protein